MLELRAESRARDFERKLVIANEPLEALAIFIATQNEVKPEEFHRFARLGHGPDDPNSALVWAPLVTSSQRDAFVTATRQAVADNFEVLEATADGQFVAASEREEYLPVLFAEAYDGRPSVLGIDILSTPDKRRRVESARDEGHPLATPPLHMFAGTTMKLGFMVIWPVYSTGEVPTTLGWTRPSNPANGLSCYPMTSSARARIAVSSALRPSMATSCKRGLPCRPSASRDRHREVPRGGMRPRPLHR